MSRFGDRSVLTVAVAIAGSLLGNTSPVGAAERAFPLRDSLDAFVAAFQQLSSIHIEAESILERRDSSGSPSSARGSIEYWETIDGKYRLRCATAGDSALFDDVDFAYDGEKFRIFFPGMNSEFYLGEDTTQTPAALPNPFYLPVYFGWPLRPECGMCRQKLSSVADIRRELRRASSDLVRESSDVTKGVSTLSIGPIFGRSDASTHEVDLRARGDSYEVAEIRRFDSSGRLATSISFTEWATVEGGRFQFPRTISMRAFDEHGALTMRLEYLITKVDVNLELLANLFVPTKRHDTLSLDAGTPVHDHIPGIE
jgi:hypothetical protein